MAGVGPSLLLHPTDFLDANDVPEMGFFPAMRMPADRKMAMVDLTLQSLTRYWQTGTVADHAQAHVPAEALLPLFVAEGARLGV